MEHREEVVNRLKRLPPLEKDSAWKQLHDPDDWGVADASELIDKALYGALVLGGDGGASNK
jgi:hypothetical protein